MSHDHSNSDYFLNIYNINNQKVKDIKCPICYDLISQDYMITECNHHFHLQCLKKWFKTSKTRTCPLCRKVLRHFKINVIKLDLSFQCISELENNYFLTYPNVQVIYLTCNQLTSLPESLFSLRNLKELYLNHNKLTLIPESIGRLTSLEKLDLSFNNLTSLPESIFSLSNIKELYLDHNNIVEISDEINLKYVNYKVGNFS